MTPVVATAAKLAVRCGVVPLNVETGYRPRLAFADALRDERAVADWYGSHPSDGIGIVANVARLVVIDIESPQKREGGPDGFATLRALEASLELCPLPPTRTHRTKSGGEHRVFRCDAPLRSAQGELRGAALDAPGIDIVAGHALLRWPPTTGYAVASSAPCAPLPREWVDALSDVAEPEPEALPERMRRDRGRKYAEAALSREASALAVTGVMRNCELVRAAFRLGQLCPPLSPAEVEARLLEASDANGELGDHGKRSVLGTIRRGLRAGAKSPRSAPQ